MKGRPFLQSSSAVVEVTAVHDYGHFLHATNVTNAQAGRKEPQLALHLSLVISHFCPSSNARRAPVTRTRLQDHGTPSKHDVLAFQCQESTDARCSTSNIHPNDDCY